MRRDAGFTLLEAMIALAIAGLALTALVRGTLDGVTLSQAADRYEEAVARAQSRLAAIGSAPQPGDRQGDDGGGYHWHVRVVPLGAARTVPPTGLYAVSVAVSWEENGARRVVNLQTERIGLAGNAP
jgi:general secretion pathway protein I